MIRYLAPALAVFLLIGAATTGTHAQIAFRAGGGLYVEEKEPGWHGSIILPFGSKPAGIMLAGEYYTKDGNITVPCPSVDSTRSRSGARCASTPASEAA